MTVELNLPKSLVSLRLPRAVNARLHELLDKQDSGTALTKAERKEAEGLVELADFLSLLKMRATRPRKHAVA